MSVEQKLEVIASNRDLVGVGSELIQERDREYRLGQASRRLRKPYDFVLVECPPALNMLTVNALTAADSVLIPPNASILRWRALENWCERFSLSEVG